MVISSSYSEEIWNNHEDYFRKLAILTLTIVSVGWRILSNIVKLKYFLNFRDNYFTKLSDTAAGKRILQVSYMPFSNLAMFNQGHKYVNRICKLTFSNFYVAFKEAPITVSKPNNWKLKYKIVARLIPIPLKTTKLKGWKAKLEVFKLNLL